MLGTGVFAASGFAGTLERDLFTELAWSPADTSKPAIGGVHPSLVKFDPSIRFMQSNREAPVIDTIIVVGNKVTNPFVLFAEMELDSGSVATPEAMKRDQDRLESLGLFSRAHLKLGSMTRNRTALIVDVTELWYIWPGLYLAVDENDPTRASYGGIVTHDNFRGRNETLSISGRYGYITGFEFEWDIPYLSPQHTEWSLNTQGSFTNEDEPRFLKDRTGVTSRQRLVSGKVGYRFSLENYGWFKLGARSRAFESRDGRHLWLTESESGEDIVGEVEIAYERDTRTYKAWPDNAYVYRFVLGSGIGLNHIASRFVKPEVYGASYYTPVDRIHFAGRVRATTYIGDIPIYERVLLDRENGIRTSMQRVFEGSWRVLSTVEFRTDVLPVRYLTFKLWEPVNQYTRNLKFGISTALFTDYGVVGGVEEPSPFSDSPETEGWDVAYGFGLILHIPYRDMIRAEVMRSARYPSDGLLFRIRLGTFF